MQNVPWATLRMELCLYEAGNEGQAKADRSSENERERIVLNKLVRRAVQCTILV